MLPHLLPRDGERHHPDLAGFVRFAVRSAKRVEARGAIPAISEVANRRPRRPSRLIDECRTLSTYLAGLG